jgi:deoxyribose-phosphate aldolase
MAAMSSPRPSSENTRSVSEDNQRLANLIDHTKLMFAADEDETLAIRALCGEARAMGFYGVCVRPKHVPLAKMYLAGSQVKIATVIGFPNQKVKLDSELQQPTIGNSPTGEKQAETRQAIQDGADELDLVINIFDLKQDRKDGGHRVKDELAAVAAAADHHPIKVIIEIDLLSDEDIVQATVWCAETGMAMVKTSTGMVEGGHGATLHAVHLIADTLQRLNTTVGIKASGGLKTRAQALQFADAGVSRLGTSSGVAIIEGEVRMDNDVY